MLKNLFSKRFRKKTNKIKWSLGGTNEHNRWGFQLKYKSCIAIDLSVENAEFKFRIYYGPLNKINFNGIILSVLENIEKYIKMEYGDYWMIPISKSDSNDLVLKNFKKTIILTKDKHDRNIGKIMNGTITLYNYSLNDNLQYQLRPTININELNL